MHIHRLPQSAWHNSASYPSLETGLSTRLQWSDCYNRPSTTQLPIPHWKLDWVPGYNGLAVMYCTVTISLAQLSFLSSTGNWTEYQFQIKSNQIKSHYITCYGAPHP